MPDASDGAAEPAASATEVANEIRGNLGAPDIQAGREAGLSSSFSSYRAPFFASGAQPEISKSRFSAVAMHDAGCQRAYEADLRARTALLPCCNLLQCIYLASPSESEGSLLSHPAHRSARRGRQKRIWCVLEHCLRRSSLIREHRHAMAAEIRRGGRPR